MRTDFWDQFGKLVTSSSGLMATDSVHSSDGTSTITTYDEVQMRALGQLKLPVPLNAWVRAGHLVEAAPNLPRIEVTI